LMSPTTAARMLLGGAGLLSTRRVLPFWGADPRSARVVAIARILAARHLAQGAVVALHPTRRTGAASVAVDLLHGSTMVALATVSRSYRRPATTSACIALTFAALTGVRLKQNNSSAAWNRLPQRQTRNDTPLRPIPAQSNASPITYVDPSPAADAPPTHQPPTDQARANRQPAEHRRADSASHLELIRHEAHERAAQITRRSEDALSKATAAPRRSLSRAGALLLLALGLWLLIGQWLLSLPLTSVASTTGIRDEGFAVLTSLAALRLLTTGRSATATSVALLAGVLLVCSGSLLDHSATRAAVNEVACGAVAILSAIATLDRQRAGARGAGTHPVVAQLV
jgi:hypothetical protein